MVWLSDSVYDGGGSSSEACSYVELGCPDLTSMMFVAMMLYLAPSDNEEE